MSYFDDKGEPYIKKVAKGVSGVILLVFSLSMAYAWPLQSSTGGSQGMSKDEPQVVLQTHKSPRYLRLRPARQLLNRAEAVASSR